MASYFGFPAYGGTDKKVFISYKKADEARVSAIAREINNLGFNVWYDEAGGEGLQLGRKWEESISENMALSSAVIAFISKAFFTTQGYMRTEFNMANSDKVRRLYIVFLDDISYNDIDIADRSLWSQISSYQGITASGMTAREVALKLKEPILQLYQTDYRDLNEIRHTINLQRSQRNDASRYTSPSAAPGYSYASPSQKSWFEQNKSLLSVLGIFAVAILIVAAIISSSAGNSGAVSDPPDGITPQNYPQNGSTGVGSTYENIHEELYEEPSRSPLYSVGDTITLGSFNQDNYSGNGKESIDWLVLDADNEKALILSVKALDIRSFHNTRKHGDTWDTSDLRIWMNGTFYDSAFDSNEKQMILYTTIYNDSNPDYGTYSGDSTSDRVFLLSAEEAQIYLTQSQRKAKPTQYIKDQGGWSEDTCWWWLRTAGDANTKAVYVDERGNIGLKGNYINDEICVRPAMYIRNY